MLIRVDQIVSSEIDPIMNGESDKIALFYDNPLRMNRNEPFALQIFFYDFFFQLCSAGVGMSGTQEKNFWVPMGTGYLEDRKLWVPICM